MKKTTISVQKIGSAPKTTTKTKTKKRTQKSSKQMKQTPLHRITSKNVSSKIPNGTIIHTRDEFFEGQGNYLKPGYENKGNYRRAVVVDSNRNDELAVVKLTTKGNSYYLFQIQKETNDIDTKSKYFKQSNLKSLKKSKYKPFIETLNDENKPIKLSPKFICTGEYIHEKLANDIKATSLTNPATKEIQENKQKLKKLKNR